ncbi:MAG: hypothetical protein ACE5OZ_01630 [Candidatus Heimdallarchaeota archaeon]
MDASSATLRAQAMVLLSQAQNMEQKDKGTDLEELIQQNKWVGLGQSFATVAVIVAVLIAFVIWLTAL